MKGKSWMSDSLSEVVTKKGAITSQHILDSAVDVIYEIGLPNLTFRAVADRAGLSRGALLHHFKDKAALLTSLIGHIYRKRQRDMFEGVQALTEEQRRIDQSGVDLMLWMARQPYSVVLRELQAYARTEKNLMKVLQREAAEHVKQLTADRPELFPEWEFEGSPVSGASLLIRAATNGFATMSVHAELEADEAEFVELLKFALRKISQRPSSS